MDDTKMGLTVREAAKYSGLGEHLLRSLIKAKKLPAVRVGQRAVIRRDQLDAFMRANSGVDLTDLAAVREAIDELI